MGSLNNPLTFSLMESLCKDSTAVSSSLCHDPPVMAGEIREIVSSGLPQAHFCSLTGGRLGEGYAVPCLHQPNHCIVFACLFLMVCCVAQIAKATVTWTLATQRAIGHFISSAKTVRNSALHSLADLLGPKPDNNKTPDCC